MATSVAGARTPRLPLPRPLPSPPSPPLTLALRVEPPAAREAVDATGVAIMVQQQLGNLYGVAGAAAVEWSVVAYDARTGEALVATNADAVPFLRCAAAGVTAYQRSRIALRWVEAPVRGGDGRAAAAPTAPAGAP